MKKEKTIELVWRYLSEQASASQCKSVIVALGEIAQAVNRTERMVQYAIKDLDGKIERKFREKTKLTYKTIIKNNYNEYIVHEFYPGTNEVISPTLLKDFKAFKELKDLKAEEENFSPLVHIDSQKQTSDLPPLVEKNLHHLVRGYALTVVDHVLERFKKRLRSGKIKHMIAWIRGALVNEQAIYDAIGFDMYKARIAKQQKQNAPKTHTAAQPKRHAEKKVTQRPMPMPVYSSTPPVSADDVAAIIERARAYEREKTAQAVS